MDLDDLLAREAIRQRLHHYCRAMDRRDDKLGYTVWHQDGTTDYGPLFRRTGREFVDWVSQRHLRLDARAHQVTSVGIVVDGRHAVSEAYVTATRQFSTTEGLWETTVIDATWIAGPAGKAGGRSTPGSTCMSSTRPSPSRGGSWRHR